VSLPFPHLHPTHRNRLCTCRTIAITWGGARYAWSSASIITPLVLGFFGLGLFFWFELTVAEFPTIPPEVVGNRTSVLTFVAVLLHGVCMHHFPTPRSASFDTQMIIMAVIYVLPTYFQACFGATASESGVKTLPLVSFCINFRLFLLMNDYRH
jgi:hypothetical protein